MSDFVIDCILAASIQTPGHPNHQTFEKQIQTAITISCHDEMEAARKRNREKEKEEEEKNNYRLALLMMIKEIENIPHTSRSQEVKEKYDKYTTLYVSLDML